jgi:outer membrane protein
MENGKTMKSMKQLAQLFLIFWLPFSQADDLMSIYQLALQNDPQLQAAKEQLNSARETKSLARSQLLPALGLGGTYNSVRSEDKSISNAPTTTFKTKSLGLNLTQPIYRRDRLLQLEQADSTIAKAEAEYASAEVDLMVRSTTAYFDILSAEDDLRVAQAEREATGRQLEQAQQRFDVGLIAITDVHEAQAAFDAARASEIAAINSLDNTWEALYEIIGPQARSALAKLGENLELSPPEPNKLQNWSDTAQQQNYAIIASRANLKVLEKQIDISKSGHYPTLDLVGGYNIKRSDMDQTTSMFDVNESSIGLSLELPIYSGGAVSATTRQSQANYRAAQQSLDQTRRAINRQVRDAFRGVLSSISQVEALKAATVSAQSALESTQAGYEVGTRTIVDVLNMQRSLFSSQRDYLNSRYGYILNGLALKSAAGTLSEADLQNVSGWLEQ